MPSIDFSLRDGSSQTVNLTNISNIIYIAYTKPDGSTINVPISFMFSSISQQLTVDDFITSFFTSSMNNENADVIRESGYRVSELFVTPSHADDRALSKFKFCKELCYNINGKTDECIEVTSGSLPKGLELKTNDNGNFIIEGYASQDNVPNNYSCLFDLSSQTLSYDAMVESQSLLKFEDIYKSREIEFRNVQYTGGSTAFCTDEVITDTMTNDSAVLKCIETYVLNGETRTRMFVDELKDDKTMFKYYDERIECDVYCNTKHDKNWKGILMGSDCCSCITYDEVRVKYPSNVSDDDYQECSFTLGLCSASGSGYCETKEFSLSVRRNYDEVRDEMLIPTPYGTAQQGNYSAYNHDSVVYYYGDTTKASYLALFYLPLTTNNGSLKNIAISYAELDLKTTNDTDLDIAIDGNITFTRNVSGNLLASNIELNTENI